MNDHVSVKPPAQAEKKVSKANSMKKGTVTPVGNSADPRSAPAPRTGKGVRKVSSKSTGFNFHWNFE
jgi:hypothetical protein